MSQKNSTRAFTLIELLVVIAIIAVLASILFLGLSQAKELAHSTTCKNKLRQMSLALVMYADESNSSFPFFRRYEQSGNGGPLPGISWYDSLAPYLKLSWTNRSFHCPRYRSTIADFDGDAPVDFRLVAIPWESLGSYAYNGLGTSSDELKSTLGLGAYHGPAGRNPAQLQSRVVAPSEFFTLSDSRLVWTEKITNSGLSLMWLGRHAHDTWEDLRIPRHGKGYNTAFADGHVSLRKRENFIKFATAARNFNFDNEEHPESWRR